MGNTALWLRFGPPSSFKDSDIRCGRVTFHNAFDQKSRLAIRYTPLLGSIVVTLHNFESGISNGDLSDDAIVNLNAILNIMAIGEAAKMFPAINYYVMNTKALESAQDELGQDRYPPSQNEIKIYSKQLRILTEEMVKKGYDPLHNATLPSITYAYLTKSPFQDLT